MGTEATIHLWDGQNIAADLNENGGASVKYVRGTNLLKSEIGSSGKYYLYNGHGDVVQLTSSTGQMLWRYEYDAFGNERAIDGQDPANDTNPFRYCSEYFDKETGTIYLRARYYDPATGRFLEEDITRARRMNIFDPYGDYQGVKLSGGVFRDAKTGQYIVDDPLSLNLYTYCQNNPVYFQDSNGNLITPANVIGALIGAGIGAILGNAIANHFGLTGWKKAAVVAGGALLAGVVGWFAGPAVLALATKVTISAIAAGKFELNSLSTGIISALGLGQQAAQNAMQTVGNYVVKSYHLLSGSGRYSKFVTDSLSTANQWVTSALSQANSFVVNSRNSFYTIVKMGQTVGTKGEQCIKIVFSVTGKIISAYPVK